MVVKKYVLKINGRYVDSFDCESQAKRKRRQILEILTEKERDVYKVSIEKREIDLNKAIKELLGEEL